MHSLVRRGWRRGRPTTAQDQYQYQGTDRDVALHSMASRPATRSAATHIQPTDSSEPSLIQARGTARRAPALVAGGHRGHSSLRSARSNPTLVVLRSVASGCSPRSASWTSANYAEGPGEPAALLSERDCAHR